MSAAFNKFDSFVEALAEGAHKLDTDVLKVALSNSTPLRTYTVKANINEISSAGSYAPAQALQASSMQSSGTYKLILNPATFVAAGGSIGPFRYIILFNDSAVNKELIGWYDYESNFTLNAGESFVVNFDSTDGALDLV